MQKPRLASFFLLFSRLKMQVIGQMQEYGNETCTLLTLCYRRLDMTVTLDHNSLETLVITFDSPKRKKDRQRLYSCWVRHIRIANYVSRLELQQEIDLTADKCTCCATDVYTHMDRYVQCRRIQSG